MTDSTTSDDKATKQRKAYGLAQTRLREAHREEFNAFMAEEAKALGIEWKPKPTDEEKAKAELDKILAAHPGLREQMGLPEEAGETVVLDPVDRDV
jgi:hypothetical protein